MLWSTVCMSATELVTHLHPSHTLLFILCRVRVVGGAYGGFCDFDNHSGMFTYSSYRDPNLLKTVDVYDGEYDMATCNQCQHC